MLGICSANSGNSLHCLLVTHVATQGVARVRWIHDDPTILNDGDSLPDKTLLRVIRVNFEELAHWVNGYLDVALIVRRCGAMLA